MILAPTGYASAGCATSAGSCSSVTRACACSCAARTRPRSGQLRAPGAPTVNEAARGLQVREHGDDDQTPQGLQGDGGDCDEEEAHVASETDPIGRSGKRTSKGCLVACAHVGHLQRAERARTRAAHAVVPSPAATASPIRTAASPTRSSTESRKFPAGESRREARGSRRPRRRRQRRSGRGPPAISAWGQSCPSARTPAETRVRRKANIVTAFAEIPGRIKRSERRHERCRLTYERRGRPRSPAARWTRRRSARRASSRVSTSTQNNPLRSTTIGRPSARHRRLTAFQLPSPAATALSAIATTSAAQRKGRHRRRGSPQFRADGHDSLAAQAHLRGLGETARRRLRVDGCRERGLAREEACDRFGIDDVVDHREDEATADRASADEHRGAVAKREVVVLDELDLERALGDELLDRLLGVADDDDDPLHSGLTEREDGALEQSDAANLSQGLRAAFETETGSRGEDHARGDQAGAWTFA